MSWFVQVFFAGPAKIGQPNLLRLMNMYWFVQVLPDYFISKTSLTCLLSPGCGFNIFRIFGRTEVNQEAQVQEAAASGQMSGSDNCASWLFSCFEPGDGPKKTDEGM